MHIRCYDFDGKAKAQVLPYLSFLAVIDCMCLGCTVI